MVRFQWRYLWVSSNVTAGNIWDSHTYFYSTVNLQTIPSQVLKALVITGIHA